MIKNYIKTAFRNIRRQKSALLTISLQAIKAALSNPVESLRYE